RPIQGVERVAKVFYRKVRRVDHLVGSCANVDEHPAFLVDRRLHAAGRVDRMAVAGLAVTAKKHVVRRVVEQHVRGGTRRVERLEIILRVREERTATRVDDEGDLLFAALSGDVDGRCHEGGGQVVEGVVAEVLEDLHRLRFARAGEPCDDDEVRLTRGGQSGRIHDRTTPTIEITIAPRNAATGPSRWNPRTGTSETTYSMSAPMTERKRPRVKQVNG